MGRESELRPEKIPGTFSWYVESFFSSLKNELVHHRQFQNQAEAQVAITDYIERFYNRQRLHQALGYRSPEEFEQQESGA